MSYSLDVLFTVVRLRRCDSGAGYGVGYSDVETHSTLISVPSRKVSSASAIGEMGSSAKSREADPLVRQATVETAVTVPAEEEKEGGEEISELRNGGSPTLSERYVDYLASLCLELNSFAQVAHPVHHRPDGGGHDKFGQERSR